MNIDEVNKLGNILNTSFGKSSSPRGDFSIKCDLAGETLTLKYTTIVHFAAEKDLRDQVSRQTDESQKRLSEQLKNIKKEFKESTGRTLKTSEISTKDNIELIHATASSPRKVAYYRMNKTFQVI
jgi:hypothetical protein